MKSTWFLIFIFTLWMCQLNGLRLKFQPLPLKYVVLSSTLDPRYLFLLPITAAAWIKLGVHPIVILIENNMTTELSLKLNNTIHLLTEMNVSMHYFKSEKISPTSLSQIIRLFCYMLPVFGKLLTDENILIVSDADLIVFNLSNHIPDTQNGKSLHLYNANCCEPINVPPTRGNHKVKQYPLGTVGATVQAWKEIMGFKRTFQTVNLIEKLIINEFGEKFFHPNDDYSHEHKKFGSHVWYADQSLISYKINEWRKKKNNEMLIYESTTLPRRIDRIKWPTTEQFSQMDMRDFDDCHQPIMPYKNDKWAKYLPFLKMVFKNNKTFLKKFNEHRVVFSSD